MRREAAIAIAIAVAREEGRGGHVCVHGWGGRSGSSALGRHF